MPGRKSDCKTECSQEPCFVILPLQTHQAPLGCSEDTFIAIVLGTELIGSASGVEGIETEGTPLSSRVELEWAQQVNSRSAQCRWCAGVKMLAHPEYVRFVRAGTGGGKARGSFNEAGETTGCLLLQQRTRVLFQLLCQAAHKCL